jgi:hypothetical protein
MRIAFDLDDTLIPCHDQFPTEPPNYSLISKFFFTEHLRVGTVDLFKRLQAEGFQLWVYTSSYRTMFRIWITFLCYGIWLHGIVNQSKHERHLRRTKHGFALKFPPLFAIDYLVDNSEAIYHEGMRLGYDVLLVNPDDKQWTTTIQDYLLPVHPLTG